VRSPVSFWTLARSWSTSPVPASRIFEHTTIGRDVEHRPHAGIDQERVVRLFYLVSEVHYGIDVCMSGLLQVGLGGREQHLHVLDEARAGLR
jgi:hypothetical protein